MLLVKALLLVCSATAVLAGTRIDAIVSGACMVGQDTSRDTKGEEVFSDPRNHATAVASILKHSADRSQFQPRQKGVITDPKVYKQFLNDVQNFPGFQSHHMEMERLDLQGDREQFKREVAKKYKTDRNDPWQIARAFEHLIPQEVQEDGQEWLLNYVVLNTQGSQHGGGGQKDISVEICSITLKLAKDQQNDMTKIKRQTAEMKLNIFTVNKDYLRQNAKNLSKRVQTMDARKALRELSSNGQLGDDNSGGDELDAWLEGLFIPSYARWNVQF
jgi:hypothetical protein